MTATGRNALLIGGLGRVARLTTPLLRGTGFAVTSVVRSDGHVDAVRRLGAVPAVQNLVGTDRGWWRSLITRTDVVIWAAGAAGAAAPSDRLLLERDVLVTLIDALDDTAYPPRLLALGYGALALAEETAGGRALGTARRAVDERLRASRLEDAVLLGPASLTDAPSRGITLLDADFPLLPRTSTVSTSRQLVARVLVELAGRRQTQGRRRLNFADGHGRVSAV